MNNIKNTLLLFVAFISINFVSAQKVDLDPFRFNFEYRNLPMEPQNKKYTTYSVYVDAPATVTQSVSRSAIEGMVNLQGFKKIYEDAHLEVRVKFNDLIIDNTETKSRTDERKDKDGKVTSSKTYYWVDVKYSFWGSYEMKDYKGTPLVASQNMLNTPQYKYSTTEYNSSSEASNYFNNNRTAIVGKLVRERMNDGFASLNAHINKMYGFPVTKDNMQLWLIDNKKHPERETMKTKWEELKPMLESVSANELTELKAGKIKEMIAYFDGLKATYNKDEKGDKKLRYAAFYNNAVLYILLDQPEKATKEAEGLIANDYDKSDGKTLTAKAEDLQVLLTKNEVKSRHFDIDLSEAKGPKN